MSNAALAIIEPDASRAFEPSGIGDAMALAKILVNSKLLPRSVQTAEAAFTIIATGRELGLTAMQSLRSIHVIEGKPSLSADLILALVKNRRDVCTWFRLVTSTDKVATYETQRLGEPEPTRMSFTWEDATRAQVTGKDNWKKYPAAMLRARCISALARAVYPDLAMGLYDPDELERQNVPVHAVSSRPATEDAEVVREGGDLEAAATSFTQRIDAILVNPESNESDLVALGREVKASIPEGHPLRVSLSVTYAKALKTMRGEP